MARLAPIHCIVLQAALENFHRRLGLGLGLGSARLIYLVPASATQWEGTWAGSAGLQCEKDGCTEYEMRHGGIDMYCIGLYSGMVAGTFQDQRENYTSRYKALRREQE